MIFLKNPNVAEIVEFKLDKLDNEFLEEDLDKIEELVYDVTTINDNIIEDGLEDLKFFKGLKKLYLLNMEIDKEKAKNIFSLPSLETIKFDTVDFEFADFLSMLNVKEIAFINTSIEDISKVKDIKKLEKIELAGMNKVKLKDFVELPLKALVIENTEIEDFEKIDKFSQLEELAINGTNIKDISFLKNFNNLKYVGLDFEQIYGNEEIVKMLRDRDTTILVDNLIEY